MVDALNRLNKMILVSGATKSGKTVLVRRVLSQEDAVWVEGGAIRSEADFWQEIVNVLGISIEHTTTTGKSSDVSTQNDLGVDAKVLGMGIGGKRTASIKDGTSNSAAYKHAATPRAAALRELKDRRIPLVVDDFHYMPRDVQSAVVRALKQPVFDGLRVTLLAVPHRTADAVKAESEIEGRIATISVPDWHKSELTEIATKGFAALNVVVSQQLIDELVEGAFSSPHLLQDLCSLLCKKGNVDRTCALPTQLLAPKPISLLFQELAAHMQPTAFSMIKKGPDRTNRIERRLRNGGGVCDIYEAVLWAIIETGPTAALVYGEISAKLKDILVQTDVPQQHETTRVLEQMAKLAADVGKSAPPLDYDKDLKEIHLTDPFFRFYLKWGVERTWH
ncbi:hypothetical protein [Burkholderia sp. Bp8977]|uniref:hypothetical protein n=1 Tax=Burkholderia sp. Bp8977 TaxID=2184548 RepID=UPI000F582C4B|nr:hypothetical protein [Burkholderia sp. Bp8977]